MKKNITPQEVEGLSPKLLEAYNQAFPSSGNFPHLATIGDMIEFLDDHKLRILISKVHNGLSKTRLWYIREPYVRKGKRAQKKIAKWGLELCDALWEAVKEVLESK